MPKFSDRMKAEGFSKEALKKKPAWEGPQSSGPQGGITNSLLSRYVACQERFRIKTIEGLEPTDRFNHSIEYGNLWHLCEELYAAGKPWEEAIHAKCKELAAKYRFDGYDVLKWYNVCKVQFPIYVNFWKKHPDMKARKPLLQEYAFKLPYELPSGRTVYLRGKMDEVDLIKDKSRNEIWLQENKSKSDPNENHIQRQLSFDLQTMLYLEVLGEFLKQSNITKQLWEGIKGFKPDIKNLAGVRYNVIRRPLSGGRHSIRQKKPTKANPKGQSLEEFYKELSECIASEPEYFFYRWDVRITPEDQQRFRREFLNPVLENLADDYDWWLFCLEHGVSQFDYKKRSEEFPLHQLRNSRLPYGIWNPVAEGVPGDYDNYLINGDKMGLVQTKDLFKELNNA